MPRSTLVCSVWGCIYYISYIFTLFTSDECKGVCGIELLYLVYDALFTLLLGCCLAPIVTNTDTVFNGYRAYN